MICLATATQQPGAYRRGGDLDQHHVIQTDAIEAVLERQDALDLVGLDHRFEHLAHLQRCLAAGKTGA
jgi:hypothetical protein